MTFKAKFRTMFPALVTASSPLTLVKAGLAYTFGVDITALRTSLDPIYISRGQTPGTTTNDSASAGNVGEYIESAIGSGAATSVTTTVPKTIASVVLTPGDWDVSGLVNGLVGTGTTSVTGYGGSISTTNNALDTNPGKFSQVLVPAFTPGSSATIGVPFPPVRVSVATTTTIYIVAYMTFTVSTMSAYGIIRARRVR